MSPARIALVLLAAVALIGVAAFIGLRVMDVDTGLTATPLTEIPDLASVLETVTVTIPEPAGKDPNADGIKIGTFLGDETRRYYGEGPVPTRLEVIWKAKIGGGTTGGTGKAPPSTDGTATVPSNGLVTWYGTGWTGQPALVRENGKLYLLVGGFDHNLRKIDAETGETLWTYKFPDVIKGSPTVFADPAAPDDFSRYTVMVGSRRGFPSSISAPDTAPFRAVSYATGKELWRLPVPHTRSYSRDADGSGFVLDGKVWVGVESGDMYVLDPFSTESWKSWQTPKTLAHQLLLGDSRASSHGGNLVLEASPALLGDRVYIASGSGHVYGMNKDTLEVEWDFFTGSDMDGTTVTTSDGFLIVEVEKQYIKGHGGVYKLDPSKPAVESVVWYFPTGDRNFADWLGGVIGSASVNDSYNPGSRLPGLVAFTAIDGNLYVVAKDDLASTTVPGPNLEPNLPTPVMVFKDDIGGAISTPIIVGDRIVAAGYDATVHVYSVETTTNASAEGVLLHNKAGVPYKVKVSETISFRGGGTYESTPIVWQGRIYIGARDGYLYCIGDPDYVPGVEAPEVP
ncbi:MAG: PQQ-binding-like beta-propeller repeat protein [Coriobacteriia bacterium]|nr:PQQ-binding-like beta-propeller repeat protein [Coriobacteriia bacterium]